MSALLPPSLPADDDALAQLYRYPDDSENLGRPYVRANMISSLDGAATAGGTSGALGGAGDRRVFGVLRRAADVVVVGAATVRDEDYSTPVAPAHPALAIVTRTSVPRTDKLYPPDGTEPIILSGGGAQVDLRAALAQLHDRGLRRVLAEGGPGILGQLFDDDLVDELCLTTAPSVVGGDAGRIVTGPDLPDGRWRPVHVVTDDEGYLFSRWRRPVER